MESHKKFEGKHSELTGKILGAFFQLHKEFRNNYFHSVKSVYSVYKKKNL